MREGASKRILGHVSIASDFLLALLPIPLVWQLQLNGRTKSTLICILNLGLFAGVAAIIKSEKQKTAFSDPDPFVHDTFTIWRFIEYDVGIITASLPSLKPLSKRVLNGTRGTTPSGPNKLWYSICPEPSDDEVPLEEYHRKIGNLVAILRREAFLCGGRRVATIVVRVPGRLSLMLFLSRRSGVLVEGQY